MIRIAVCDDDRQILDEFEYIVKNYEKETRTKCDLRLFFSGEDLLDAIGNGADFDIIFLDVELGTTTGINVGEKIRRQFDNYEVKIVFVTSKEGYDRAMFAVHPFNFIAKPLDAVKVGECIGLTVKALKSAQTVFEYRKKGESVRVNTRDILYFESSRKKVRIVASDFEDEFYFTFSQLSEHLPRSFIRTHNSYIVNYDKIKSLHRDGITLYNGTRIPVSRSYYKDIQSIMFREAIGCE